MVCDGTVTRLLEALFWEPIRVDIVSQKDVELDHDIPWMALAAGRLALRRRVVLVGRDTGRRYAFAETIFRDPDTQLRAALEDPSTGIGRILRVHRIEQFRELVRVERTTASRWYDLLDTSADAPAVVRCYGIQQQGRRDLFITEVFPEHLYVS
jgi:chorismate-pyruvate lyase